MTQQDINRQWVVAQHPDKTLLPEHFAYREVAVATPDDGQVLLRTHYLNVAPVMQRYMMRDGGGNSPESALSVGDVIHGRGVAEVIESRHPAFEVGDFVHGQVGWQTHKCTSVTPQEKLIRMQKRGLPAYLGLSALGMTGYSAYCGFVTRGEPQPGDHVLVSGAAGGVGSLVVQMAKAMGCGRVIGIAGSDKKCARVVGLGADHCINYKTEDVAVEIARHLPDGMDLFFDNVGGETLEAALDHLRSRARVVLCGSISEYNRAAPFGPRNYTRLRSTDSDLRGFFVYNHQPEFAAAEAQIADWIRAGRLRALVDIDDGFEHMPAALIGLYNGTNTGKRIVRVNPGEDIFY
ncbi:MAG: NADP-dependent oxidoreductase [Pseudomonadota bacterium]